MIYLRATTEMYANFQNNQLLSSVRSLPGRTVPVLLLCSSGDAETAAGFARQLLSLGADPNLRSRWTNMRALHYAAYFDVPQLIWVVLQASQPGGKSRAAAMERGWRSTQQSVQGKHFYLHNQLKCQLGLITLLWQAYSVASLLADPLYLHFFVLKVFLGQRGPFFY